MKHEHYTIRHGKGSGSLFLCTCCDYRVSTKDFDRTNGNVRTQAAAAMNTHHDSEHKVNMLLTTIPREGVQRMWRRW
jgi:hypothetical protein